MLTKMRRRKRVLSKIGNRFLNQQCICGLSQKKCTNFLFKCLLDSPEITSYLLQSMTLGKLHSGSNVFSTDHSSTGSHFPYVCLAHRLQFFVFSIIPK